jgi:DNA-binding response OmpR family regulator
MSRPSLRHSRYIRRIHKDVRLMSAPKTAGNRTSPHARQQLSAEAEATLVIGDIEFDWTHKRVRRMGRDLRVGRKVFYLLGLLISNPGRTFSRAHIRDVVWWRSNISLRTVDATVRRLRQAINRGGLPDPICTVLRYGYKFSENFEQELLLWLERPRKKLRLRYEGAHSCLESHRRRANR